MYDHTKVTLPTWTPVLANSKQQVEVINQAIKTLDNAIKNPKTGRGLATRQEECARSAFESIRVLQKTKASIHELQLEDGLSVLIGKSITLGLDNLAIKELRLLKRHLESVAVRGKKPSVKSATDPTTTKAFSIADLLVYPNVAVDAPVFRIILKAQTQALRLLTTCKRPSVLKDAVPMLQPECEGSPVQLLEKMVLYDTKLAATAVKAIETIASMILYLAPSTSSAEDVTLSQSKTEASPLIAYKLQTISLRIRVVSWKLARHIPNFQKPNYEKELLSPLSRCISTFARRHKNPVETYHTVKASFELFKNIIHTLTTSETASAFPSGLKVYCLLSSLAEAAGLFKDALLWQECQRKYFPSVGTSIETCTIDTRSLALKLQHQPEDPGNGKLMTKVVQGMCLTLSGAAKQAQEDLIINMAALRKIAIQLISKQRKHLVPQESRMTDDTMGLCEGFVLLCPGYICDYLGTQTDVDMGKMSSTTYDERRQLGVRLVDPTIDSTLYILKVLRGEGQLNWKTLDSTLQNNLGLLEATEATRSRLSSDDAATPSYYVKISHLYYTFFLDAQRQSPEQDKDSATFALQRSIDCTFKGTKQDRVDAFVNTKLERLSNIYYAQRLYSEAASTSERLMAELIKGDTLSAIADMAGTRPLSQLWSYQEDAILLSRAVSMCLKASFKLGPEKSTEFIKSLASHKAEEYGAFLELVLQLMASLTIDVKYHISLVGRTVLGIYTTKQFPLRRLRVLRQLSNCGYDATPLDRDILNTVECAKDVQQSCDARLHSYVADLVSFASSSMELRQERPRLDFIRQHLETWSTIMDECENSLLLASRIDNVEQLALHLNSIAEFLALHDPGPTRVAVLKMIARMNELNQDITQPDCLLITYTQVGIEYLQLGYSGQAALALDKAELQMTGDRASLYGTIKYALARSAYMLELGDLDRCKELCQKNIQLQEQYCNAQKHLLSTRSKAGVARLDAELFSICSRLFQQEGKLSEALSMARQTLRLVYRAWDLTDRGNKATTSTTPGAETSTAEDEKANSPRIVANDTERQASGPLFWHLIPALFQSLTWLSKLYACFGMYQEAMYYSEQADRVVSKMGIGALSAAALTNSANIWLKAGLLEKAAEGFKEAKRLAALGSTSITTARVQLGEALVRVSTGHEDVGLVEYDGATSTVDTLMDTTYIDCLDRIVDSAKSLTAEMSNLSVSIKKTSASKRPSRTKTPVRKKTPIQTRRKAKVPAKAICSVEDDCLGLRILKGEILRSKSQALLISKRFDDAAASLRDADGLLDGHQQIEQRILLARLSLAQGMEQLSTDPVYSVLQDSTISYPSIMYASKPNTIVSSKTPAATSAKSTTPKKAALSRVKTTQGPKFVEFLNASHKYLLEAYTEASNIAATHIVYTICSLLNVTAILLSVAGIQKGNAAHQQFSYVSYSLESARNMAYERELEVSADNNPPKQEGFEWSLIKSIELASINKPAPISTVYPLAQAVADYQRDYIDILPKAWTAITISLSETKQELCISKLQAGQSAFVLRVPLGRENSSRDMDEDDVFDYEQGRRELKSIVEAANDSAHGARNLKTKAEKAGWWDNRDILNLRMQNLLENIEKVWFGGLRGIFSDRPRNAALLARFQASFMNILDEHLPSRQRSGRKKTVPKVTLDPRILELFTGLGPTSDPGTDFSEILMDLLYYVVDILQFDGERNAYDEIDWDRMVVDTIGALEHYHDALLSSSTSAEPRHTVLILDKALHGFPWESIPCLAGQAVSRMPSLSALRERILSMQSSGSQSHPGHYVSRSAGSYILNPSGDLVNTTATLTPLLANLNLTSANTITSRIPTESEFSTLLTTSSYFLYFGHGSGTQYIRPKTIRKIRTASRNIAVSFLMGCSSGALTECGEFEPYGTPVNYLLAGCPAVVSNLWDVTDRDCDRFAVGALESWGLFGGGNDGGGKEHREKSLVEAVVEGRGKCHYRWLTAAAVVVYGVPVYLE